jgi:tetratricopeptide (TPR) repeat protein
VIERLLAAESALARDELDAAERQFSLVAEADPRNAIAVVGLARIKVRRGDREAARSLARRALEIDPDEAAAARLLGELDRAAVAPGPSADPMRPEPTAAESAKASSLWRRWLDRLRGRG